MYRSSIRTVLVKENMDLLMFVIDASASNNLLEAKNFLLQLLDIKVIRSKPILIVANKVDEIQAQQQHVLKHVQAVLELDKLEDVQWLLVACRLVKFASYLTFAQCQTQNQFTANYYMAFTSQTIILQCKHDITMQTNRFFFVSFFVGKHLCSYNKYGIYLHHPMELITKHVFRTICYPCWIVIQFSSTATSLCKNFPYKPIPGWKVLY